MLMKFNFFFIVVVELVYGDIKFVFYYLDNKLIVICNLEEIWGGGFFKYCNFLVWNYVLENYEEIKILERYMCSCFFIDFSDIY